MSRKRITHKFTVPKPLDQISVSLGIDVFVREELDADRIAQCKCMGNPDTGCWDLTVRAGSVEQCLEFEKSYKNLFEKLNQA